MASTAPTASCQPATSNKGEGIEKPGMTEQTTASNFPGAPPATKDDGATDGEASVAEAAGDDERRQAGGDGVSREAAGGGNKRARGRGKGKAKKTEKDKVKKPRAPRTHKINWTADNEKKLLLVSAVAPELCKGEDKLRRLSGIFRERPTAKSLQVKLSKLREEARELVTLIKEDGQPETSGKQLSVIKVDPEEPVFGDTTASWGDLEPALVKQVKEACEKRQQEKEWDAMQPAFVDMHKREYAEKLEAEAAKMGKWVDEAAGGG